MHKHLLYATLGLMGIVGGLLMGLADANNYVTTIPGLVVTGEQDGQIFEYGVLKFNDGSGHIIMLLDRNLGAIMTGAGADANTGSYGFKYQWGNNYGFADGCWTEGCSDSVTYNATWTFAIWDPKYDNSNYSGNTFIKSDDNHGRDYWRDSTSNSGNHVNLWGGGTDSQDNNWGVDTMTEGNITNRQGPCPAGYHVPSIGEWNNLFVYWYNAEEGEALSTTNLLSKSETNLGKDFSEMFYIPYAGQRYGLMLSNSTRSPATMNSPGEFVFLQSSSPFKNPDYGNHFLYIMDSIISINYLTVRANAGPVRCFSNDYLFPEYSVTFYDGDVEITSGTVKEGDIRSGNIPTPNNKIGYNFLYWHLTGVDTEFDFTGTNITGNIELFAKRKLIEYTISYELNGGTNSENNVTGYTIQNSVTLENPTKDGYSFDGWFFDAEFTTGVTTIPTGTTGNITLYAKWTENKKPSGGSSGGGGRSSKTSSNSEKSTEGQAGNQQPLSPQQASGSSPNREQTVTPLIGGDGEARGGSTQNYTQELQEAYEFAKEKGITTMLTIQEAQMDGKLTRIAMAKMLSQYAINVLGQKPANIITPKFNDVTDKQNSDYDDGVTLAYQLGIMGQNMPNNKFRPNDEVTRAEFATALSRMIYNTSDGEYKSTPKYYIHHMEKLVKEGIITKDDPNMKELRGYVMIMLMRSAK